MKTLILTDNEAAILRAVLQSYVDNTAAEDVVEMLTEELPLRLTVSAEEAYETRIEVWQELSQKVGELWMTQSR